MPVAPAVPQADYSSARTAAAALPRMHALVVSRRGQLVLEDYAKGYSANRLASIKSASSQPRTRSRWDPDREYGYGWWSQTFNGHRACFAWGFGGQYIFVFRELDLVVAVTSATTVSDERRGYRRQLFDLLETHILPPR